MVPADPVLVFALPAALAVALAAGLSDLWTGRIPNWLTYPAILAGFGLWLAMAGWAGLLLSLFGLLVAALPFLVGFLFGGSGGGDVKIMAALGALLGIPATLVFLVHALVVGAAMALAVVVFHGRVGDLLRRVFLAVLYLPLGFRRALDLEFVDGMERPDRAVAVRRAPGVRFGIAAALGLVWMLSAEWRLPLGFQGW